MPVAMHHITSLHAALPQPSAADAGAPMWLHLVPAGTTRGRDGRGPFVLTDPAAVIEASMAEGPIVLDENHATDHGLANGMAAPARGWIVELQARDDGIWGRVEWTASGQALIAERAYRGISPVISHTKDGGVVLRILRAALTNAPNLPLATLHSQEPTMDLNALREALGLPATADDAAILAAASAGRTSLTSLNSVAVAAGLAAGAAPDAIVTAIQARGASPQLVAEVTSLQAQLTTLTQQRARDAAVIAIDTAIRAGKPITPGLRDHYITRHTLDAEGVQRELDGLPSMHSGGLGHRAPGPGGAAGDLTPDELQVASMLGIDPAAFKKTRDAAGQTTTMGAA
ncbi:phage protease [Humitalea sp. 24SJ18S-53]|uniref:phage protease n=1 Tax=Humitalea sp. 24SJ18S-53 TaxID=3422307 RepID=UPI003D67B04B